ncbi:MAG: T9SS type A sorting domain-containing protein [Balneolales bacterium]
MKNSAIHKNKGIHSSYFRKSIPLLCLLLMSTGLSAQTLTLESSQPAHMSDGVELNTTISFTFNEALDISTLLEDGISNYILVRPDTAVVVDSVYYSGDHKTIYLDVVHNQDIDFAWTFVGLQSAEGDWLDRFQVVNYTTAPAISNITIDGHLDFVERPIMLGKSLPDDDLDDMSDELTFMNKQVLTNSSSDMFSSHSKSLPVYQEEGISKLITSSLEEMEDDSISWGHAMVWLLDNLDFMEEDESDGPMNELINIGVADPETGDYLIENVRAGEYYLLAIVIHPNSDFDVFGFGFFEDEFGNPAKVTVDETGLTNTDITVYGFSGELDPIDAGEAIVLADDVMSGFPDARTVYIWGEDSGLDDFTDQPDEFIEAVPSGKSYFWEVIYLSDTDSMIYLTQVAGSSAWLAESIHISEFPPEELPPIPLQELLTIPDPFISSQEALDVARLNGVDSLLALTDQDSWVGIDYEMGGFYFEHPDILDEESPVFWSVNFDSYVWDHEQNVGRETEAYILIDAQSGDLLGRRIESYEDDPTPTPQNTLQLIDSDPPDHSAQVNTEAQVSFIFNDTLNFDTVAPYSLGQQFFVLPHNSLEINDMWLNEDQTTVSYDVVQEEATDYTWVFLGTQSIHGAILADASIVNYTTQSEYSPHTVSGSLTAYDIPDYSPGGWMRDDYQFDPYGPQYRTIITLMEHTEFLTGTSDDFLDGMVYAGTIQDEFGNFQISNVRNGDYYLAAFVLNYEWGYPHPVGLGYYRNQDNEPIPISIQDGSLSDIHLDIHSIDQPVEPENAVDAIEAFTVALDSISIVYPDARPLIITGEDAGMYIVDEPSMEMQSSIQESYAGLPSGMSSSWEIIFVEDSEEKIYVANMMGAEIDEIYIMNFSDIPPHELPPIPISDIASLPETFISSQSALSVALENGLDSLMNEIDPYSWVEVEYELGGFYFEYPDILDEESPVFWDVAFENHWWDDEAQEGWTTEAHFLIDAETGDFLGLSINTYSGAGELVDFQDIFPMLEASMADVNENALFIQAWGHEEFHLPNYPHGTSHEWMFIWFDPDLEQVYMYETEGMEITEFSSFPFSEVPEEERPPVELIKPVTDVTLSSAAALDIAMDNGLSDALDDLPEEAYTWIDYALHRFYFSYPELLDEDSNPVWEFDLKAYVFDEFSEPIDSLQIVYLVDAVNGDYLGSRTGTTIDQVEDVPARIALHQNYPNPFNPVTNISWELDAERHVSLTVFDLLGRKVATLADEPYPVGVHTLTFDASRLASGVYIYRLDTGGVIMNRKMTVVK